MVKIWDKKGWISVCNSNVFIRWSNSDIRRQMSLVFSGEPVTKVYSVHKKHKKKKKNKHTNCTGFAGLDIFYCSLSAEGRRTVYLHSPAVMTTNSQAFIHQRRRLILLLIFSLRKRQILSSEMEIKNLYIYLHLQTVTVEVTVAIIIKDISSYRDSAVNYTNYVLFPLECWDKQW